MLLDTFYPYYFLSIFSNKNDTFYVFASMRLNDKLNANLSMNFVNKYLKVKVCNMMIYNCNVIFHHNKL